MYRWREAEAINDYWYENHPVIQSTEAKFRIPVGFHGDDAGVHGQNQVLVLTWGSIAAHLPTLDSRLIFTMVRAGDMIPGSLHALLEVLVWSLQALAEGVFPRCDHKGREFSDGLISGRGSSLADRQNTRFSPCRFWAEAAPT